MLGRSQAVPIACSLSAADLRDREVAWRKLLTASLVARDEIDGGVRLTVHPGSAPALRELVELERECCPWITFGLDGATVAMTATGDGAEVLRRMFATA